MDADPPGILARWLTQTPDRRLVLRGLVGLGILSTAGITLTDAKKRRKLVFNQFGCVNLGGKCRGNDANCCSGICEGKKPKKGKKDKSRCAGHDASTCQAGQDACAGEFVACASRRSEFARCVTTTGNAPYCAGDVFCRSCARDADCLQEDFESGAACIVCSDCPETTACATLRTFA
jgi:hypothetical protein